MQAIPDGAHLSEPTHAWGAADGQAPAPSQFRAGVKVAPPPAVGAEAAQALGGAGAELPLHALARAGRVAARVAAAGVVGRALHRAAAPRLAGQVARHARSRARAVAADAVGAEAARALAPHGA